MEKVNEFCQNQLQACKLLVEKNPQEELPKKALEAVQSSLKKLNNASASVGIATPDEKHVEGGILDFAQSCLDSTYHEECQLVDKEFPDDVSNSQIRQILVTLSRPLQLCTLVGSKVNMLGTDIIECIHWRAGALLYMYCHMTITVEERKKKMDVDHFKEALCVGVGHLKLMLSTRTPLNKDDDYVASDISVPTLLEKGIFSDLHMLSLMYAGEMCYWYWEMCSTQTPTEPGALSLTTPSTQSLHKECTDSEKEALKDAQVSKDESKRSIVREVSQSESKETPTSECSGDSTTTTSIDSHTSDPSMYCVMGHSQGVDFAKEWKLDFDPQKYGQDFLSKYVDVARGPLKAQGWSYDKAVQMLVKLRRAGRVSS